MPVVVITKTNIEQHQRAFIEGANSKRVRLHDTACKGFSAEVRKSGATFWFRYFDARHREQNIHLGRLGDVTVAQARKRAETLRAEVSLGQDPAAERRERLAVPTVEQFIDQCYLPHVRDTQRGAVNLEAYARRIAKHLTNLALDEVTVTHVANFRSVLRAEGLANATVNRHLAALRRMFNLAIRWKFFKGDNPAASPGMLPETARDKYLSPTQVRALFRALDRDHDQGAAAALALLVLTGARSGEVLNARWQDVDLDRGMLTVPRSKAGRTHHIPLSGPARQVLAAQRARSNGGEHVFPGKGEGKPLSTLRGAWARVRNAAGLPTDLRMHDLRHTFASALVNNGVPLHEVGVILGHSQLSTTRRYAHHAPQRLIDTASIAASAWQIGGPDHA